MTELFTYLFLLVSPPFPAVAKEVCNFVGRGCVSKAAVGESSVVQHGDLHAHTTLMKSGTKERERERERERMKMKMSSSSGSRRSRRSSRRSRETHSLLPPYPFPPPQSP